MSIIATFLALFLDWFFGEPKSYHPLVGFGRYADRLEKVFNMPALSRLPDTLIRGLGITALCLALLPFMFVIFYIDRLFSAMPLLHVLFAACVLYFCIGWTSLMAHAQAVLKPLQEKDFAQARYAVSRIVSRNTEELDEQGVASATTESILENGADAIFAPLFWFAVAGVPGALFYRLSNTLDAMWGYKNAQYLHFGWAAAKLDDVLNWVPARLTAMVYALCGSTNNAISCWRQQAPLWKSPNAGPVMSSGAGALNVSLGGAAIYHGQIESRPALGEGASAKAETIQRACVLINRSLFVWLVLFTVFSLAGSV